MPKAASPPSLDERNHRLEKEVHELQTQNRRLEKEVHELQTQSRKLAKDSPGGAPAKPPQSQPQEVSRPPAPATAGGSAVRALFQQRCVKCHGSDGTGKPARSRLPEIPDFTKSPWQARRSDAQLLASILDGKDEMPS
jgi:mono/diheme cytochrome c family protein